MAEQRATEIREQIIAKTEQNVDEQELARALSLFDPVWDSLSPNEQARAMHLLLERVTYDGGRLLRICRRMSFVPLSVRPIMAIRLRDARAAIPVDAGPWMLPSG